MTGRRVLALALGVLMLGAFTASTALAMEVWTPQTGEVNLDSLPRDTPELRRQHAYALMGAGEWAGGVAEMRKLIEAEPDAWWVGEARLAIGRAYLSAGKFRAAFDEAGLLQGEGADPALAARASELQLKIAREAAVAGKAGLALDLNARMMEGLTGDEAAFIQKEKADILFEAGRYLDAEDAYTAIVELRPRSALVPYCWYKIADCEWHMATWLGLGLEQLKGAEAAFADFIKLYPQDPNAAEAKAKLEQARRMQAEVHARVAKFYIEVEKRPWAAANYLELIAADYPETPQAQWAAGELKAVREGGKGRLRGDFGRLELAGVERKRLGRPVAEGGAR